MAARVVLGKANVALRLAACAVPICFLANCGGGAGGLAPDPTPTKVAQVSVNPVSIEFGQVLIGKTSTQLATISNTGTADATFTQAAVTGATFSMGGMSLPFVLAAGASTKINLTFAPVAPGTSTGTASLAGDFPDAPVNIALSGKAIGLQVVATPSSISYGDVLLGNSTSKTVTLSNGGTADVSVTQATAAGNGFSITGLSLPLTLAAGQSASFTATFTPATTGSVAGTISIASNATNSPAAVSLSGNGISQLMDVSPSTLSFGSVAVGGTGAQTITLRNTGTASVTISQASVTGSGFSVSGIAPPVILPAGQNTIFSVRFAPQAAGSVTGTVSVISNASNSPATVALSATGVTSLLSVTPANLDYGDTVLGTSSTQNVTLRNTGTATVTVSQVTATGSGFSLSGLALPLTLTAGQSAPFSVKFAPQSAGAVTGRIAVLSDASNSPATVSLSANAVSILLSASPASINFGTVPVNGSSSQVVTLSNPGTSPVTLSQANVAGAGFSLSGLALPLTLAAGQTTTFTVKFAPQTGGNVTGSISVVSNAANSPTPVSLAGSGASVLLAAIPASVSFGNAKVGTSTTQAVTLTNSGTLSVIVSQATASGSGFGLSGLALPLTLAGGQSASFSTTFTPQATGSASGNLSIVSDASNSPTAVSLTGSGVNAHTVDLNWNASTSEVSGYNVYRGGVPGGPYAKINTALVKATSYSDTNVEAGQTYYYVATSLDSTGVESGYSDQAMVVVPSP